MKQVKSRYNYDPSQPLSKEYSDPEVFNAYYKCFDTESNSHFLLSHFKTDNKTQIASLMKKFTSIQAKMEQGMNTRYLTRIHDVFLTDKDKSLFLVTDFSEGGSIIDYIGKLYNLDPKTAVKIVLGVLYGLQELHKYDILNCFINLENIEIDQMGQSKLSFKCMIYKTIYLSPEFRKEHLKSRQSDIYCLGVCLYRLIYGIFPFKTQKTEELIDMVRKGPLFAVEKDDSIFPVICPAPIWDLVKGLLNINPEQRLNAVQKFEQYSKSLLQTSQLSQEVYSKFFKSKYINFFININESDQQEYSVLDPKEKKLLKLIVYKASNNQIDTYLKTVVSKYAKLPGDSFLKIYQYQIIQEEYLALVCSYFGQGTLADYRKNLETNFDPQTVDRTSEFLKKTLKQLEFPYKYLTNQSIFLKNGSLRIKFPPFNTRSFQQIIRKASNGQPYFIAPEILAGQKSQKCDSWSIGVIEYWMIYNELPKLDSQGTLAPSKKQKLPKNKLLYFYNVIEKNPNNRLNVLDEEEFRDRLKQDNERREEESPEKASNVKKRESGNKTASNVKQEKNSELQVRPTGSKLYGLGDNDNSEVSQKKPEKIRRSKKKDLPPIESNNAVNTSILPNKIEYDQPGACKYKNPIVIDSQQPLPQKNPNKFDMKMFNEPDEIKTPNKIKTFDKETTKQEQTANSSTMEYFCSYTVKLRSRFASLERNYTKSIRISIKCLVVILIYLFLFYFNFFKTSGSLIGSRQMYEPKVVQIRAFTSDVKPAINYTLVTKTPTQTYALFYNTTVPVLRDEYKCVLNDYSVKSDVARIIKSEPFVAYQVFGFLIAIINMLMVCIVIARFDICKVCHVTNFDEKKYHTLINYGMIILCIISLTSLHYLIYGGLYHLMLEPCLGKSTLPGLEFLMKNWVTSWTLRFVWAYIGIVIAYSVMIFLLIKPLKKLNKYIYFAFIIFYFMGVGIRGMSKSYSAHQNVFGVCGQLLALLVALFLFFTDLIFACFVKTKAQENADNNIDTRSIQDFNRTEEYFIGNQTVQDYNEK